MESLAHLSQTAPEGYAPGTYSDVIYKVMLPFMRASRIVVPGDQRSRFLGASRKPYGRFHAEIPVRLSEQHVVVLALCLHRSVCQRETMRICKTASSSIYRRGPKLYPLDMPSRSPMASLGEPER